MSDNLDLSASITTEEPEIAATLSDLRYLVFEGKKGDTGDSAYEEAVSLGFVGTEAEWIASLKGDKGDVGALADLDASYDETTKTLTLGTKTVSYVRLWIDVETGELIVGSTSWNYMKFALNDDGYLEVEL